MRLPDTRLGLMRIHGAKDYTGAPNAESRIPKKPPLTPYARVKKGAFRPNNLRTAVIRLMRPTYHAHLHDFAPVFQTQRTYLAYVATSDVTGEGETLPLEQ